MPRRLLWRLELALVTLVAFAAGAGVAWEVRNYTSTWASAVESAPLRNYGVVWEGKLTRSGMPKIFSQDDGAWSWLRRRGVRSVVTFRTENDVDYGKYGFERVLRLPMREKPPSDDQAEEFLKFIQDPANQPVHIHCTAGRDRTGMMAALVRYSIDGWPMERALVEARLYRDDEDLSSWRVEWLRQWAARHSAGSFRRQ